MKLVWNVYYHNFNKKKIEIYNIFDHYSFAKEVEKSLKKIKNKDEFAEDLRKNLFYYFWAKSEWEVVITSWAPHIKMSELDRLNTERKKHIKEWDREPYSLYVNPDVNEKIDVYQQVMNNFDVFLDYVWNSKIHRPRKSKV